MYSSIIKRAARAAKAINTNKGAQMITLMGLVVLLTGGAWFIAGLGGELLDEAEADMRRRAQAQAQAQASKEFWMNERARIAARSKVIF